MEQSNNFSKIKLYFDAGMWSAKMVSDAVAKGWITAEEYASITGVTYVGEDSSGDLASKVQALENENFMLKAQIQAMSDRNDFIEDCIAEMAMAVYA